MNSFKIRFWDDDEVIRSRISGCCLDLNTKYGNIECQFVDYNKILKNEDKINESTDLFIIDLLDEKGTKKLIGFDILEFFKNTSNTKPVIAYTTGVRAGGDSIDFYQYEQKYVNVVFIKKSEDADTSKLKNEIEAIIKSKFEDQFIVDSSYVNEFKQQLNYFGVSRINQILFDIKDHYGIPISEKVHLKKLKSGFSGAILFKFSYNNSDYVLKISRDVKLLESELIRAKKLYPKFPSKFFNSIESKEFYSASKDSMAIVIKLIPDSITLFDYIFKSTPNEIFKVLEEVYNNNGLIDHYKTQKKEYQSWTVILNKFKDGRFLIINEVYNELKPLLVSFNLNDVKQFIDKNDFGNLNPIKIDYKGAITLNHLDLHSKNILIQGKQTPFLIDTGVMDYGYWCFDLCRLIVDLFINGIDYDSKDFFDITLITKNLNSGSSLIKLEPLPVDPRNKNIILAINWLTSNAEKIYGSYFKKWEFQLGLMKEFLQMSYRTGSVPHSKRALSLELAYKCMLEAEKNAMS